MIPLHTGSALDVERSDREPQSSPPEDPDLWMDGRKASEGDEGEIKTNRRRTGASKGGGWRCEVHKKLGAKSEGGAEVKKTKRQWRSGEEEEEEQRGERQHAALIIKRVTRKVLKIQGKKVREAAS